MDYQLITTTEALADYCSNIQDCSNIAIDTEFMRERTYFPLLSLIQIASEKGHAIIDPLAENISLEPLSTILTAEHITKIFHSGDQDIELFYHVLNLVPQPIFDTQIAAQALGLSDAIAYHNLVQHLLGITLDKSQQYTHWNKRPLSEAQLEYALADVTHLLELTPMLKQQLQERGRENWVEDAHAELIDIDHLTPDLDKITKRIKHNLRKPIQLAALEALATWREDEAIRRNLPRGFVMKDEVIVEIARRLPATTEELGNMRLLRPIKDSKKQETLILLLDEVKKRDPATYPTPRKKPDATANGELVGLLSLILKQRCREEQVAAKLIATRRDLEQVALGHTDIACMQGWRYDIFGKYATQLLKGNLHFHWDSTSQQVVMD